MFALVSLARSLNAENTPENRNASSRFTSSRVARRVMVSSVANERSVLSSTTTGFAARSMLCRSMREIRQSDASAADSILANADTAWLNAFGVTSRGAQSSLNLKSLSPMAHLLPVYAVSSRRLRAGRRAQYSCATGYQCTWSGFQCKARACLTVICPWSIPVRLVAIAHRHTQQSEPLEKDRMHRLAYRRQLCPSSESSDTRFT